MDLSRLNNKQREAAMHIDGPLLILAGAGSGKTATMTHRIAYLIEQGVRPYEILAVTFTNKAANEMRERVQKLVGETRGMWILTFHAMSLRIIREYYEVIGYKENFTVYDTVDTKTLLKNILKDLNVDTKAMPQPYITAIISKQKEKDIDPEKFLEYSGGGFREKKIYEVYKEYQKRLKNNNAMDFDDLLLNCLHILKKCPEALANYQERFRYIMVDEYQDTNHIQYEIISMLASRYENLAVVGDDDQCIYEWRGADIANILDFEKDFPNAKVIKLEQNYRSFGNILAAAHSVIKNNRGRKDKELWTDKAPGDKIVYKRATSDKEEANYVAQQISLMSGTHGYDDFAVLYRTNAQSRLFEDSLRKLNIPYQVLSGFSFYERKETKDMICYMRLVVNPDDDIALERVINEPKRGVGPTTLAKLKALSMVVNKSLFDVLDEPEIQESLNAKAREEVRKFVELIKLCQAEKANLRVSDIYDNLLIKSGYMKALEDENTVESESRIENLLDFKSFIYDFEKEKLDANEEATLDEFLERVSTNSDQDNYDSENGKVSLMTMHSAKGLEFPVVFIPGMEEGLFPSARAIDEGENGMEEERRLCYVGMTRAMEKLYLTSAEYRVLYGKPDYTTESTFLKELDKDVLDKAGDSVYQGSRRFNNKMGIDTGSFDGFAEKAFVPYDPLKYAKAEIKKAVGETEFTEGDNVTHAKFGHGIVVEMDEKTVTVIFDTVGTKKLAKGVAPLKKVN